MDFRKNGLSCQEAKEQDMVAYLSSLGHEPAKIRGNDFWYLSPLRNEQTASFKVNRKLNLWYDHGIGKGGNLIDFAILYHDCTVGDFLRMLSGDFSVQQQKPFEPYQNSKITEPKISITKEHTLSSVELFNYLRERQIAQDIADTYCKEVSYIFEGRTYYAIGFKNDAGGYELRNRYFKGSSSPKDMTHLKSGAKTLLVFEGFFDFLSYQSIIQKMDTPLQDYLILNSLSFMERAISIMQDYELSRLFLDNDTAGQNCSLYACSLDERFKDESGLYQNYKDLNDFLCRKQRQA
jgi:hypothetical protein